MRFVKIKGYDDYFICDTSQILSLKNPNNATFLSPSLNKNGYYYVNLTKNGKSKSKAVHRLVAENFIDNPKNKSQVNHLDGDKTNNHVKNLDWCTSEENARHSVNIGLTINKRGREVKEIRILNRTLEVEKIKEENNTQYRIWYRSFTNMLVNETILKENVVVNFIDHKSVVETMQKRIEELEIGTLEMSHIIAVDKLTLEKKNKLIEDYIKIIIGDNDKMKYLYSVIDDLKDKLCQN